MPRILFLGAAETVTGSRFVVEGEHSRVLIDCGMFQGGGHMRRRNWRRLGAGKVDAVILTHAHIDHTGYFPRMERSGYHGPVYVTEGTADLLPIMWRDSAHLLEADAERASRREGTEVAPLYTDDDVEQALKLLKPTPLHQRIEIAKGAFLTFYRAGHILGSSHVLLEVDGKRIGFSGDIGRFNAPLIRDPEGLPQVDTLVIESTYGNRLHARSDPNEQLLDVITKTHKRGGIVLIPAFSVGRTQELLFRLRQLEDSGALPELEVIVDSPMATDVTALYLKHPEELDEEVRNDPDFPKSAVPRRLRFTRQTEESKALNHLNTPAVIISAAGMCTGGRILHHLRRRITEPKNTICLVGYMAGGTLGRRLIEGETEVRIHGRWFEVNASVTKINALSAHADRLELREWLKILPKPPEKVFVVHGEPESAYAFRDYLKQRGWDATVPTHGAIEDV